jgi:hypothetical protein
MQPWRLSARLPYLSFANSPFNGGSFSYFYLENFEDHLLNTPGVTADAGGVASVIFGPSIHDSVDADDGAINGSGLGGDSYFTGNGAAGVRFTFNAGVLGGLPTSAGLVWTDGGGGTPVTFTVFVRTGSRFLRRLKAASPTIPTMAKPRKTAFSAPPIPAAFRRFS